MTSVDSTRTATQVCTFCRTLLEPEQVHLGPPFITARQLATTTTTTIIRTPALLSDLLFKELDQVPYCSTCRDELAEKRTTEQLKFLVGSLLILALALSVPLYFLFAA